MKKILLWGAIVTLATISCTQTDSLDESSQKPISFDTSVGKPSRAIISGTTYPTSETFGVTAFYKPASGTYDYTNGKYFSNLQIGYSGSAWKSTGDVYYWPPTGTLKFAAYSPYNSATYSYNATNGSQFTSFSQNTNVSTPIDLMYAESAADLTSGAVALSFKHALTQLYFTIQTAQKGFTFQIKELSLTTLYNTGSFASLNTPAWTTSGTNDAAFTVYSDATGVPVVATGSPYEFPNRLAVIPQSAVGVKIHLKFDLLVLGSVNEADQTKDVVLSGTWAPNQRVKYAITISRSGLTEITYTPTVTDWSADTVTPVTAN